MTHENETLEFSDQGFDSFLHHTLLFGFRFRFCLNVITFSYAQVNRIVGKGLLKLGSE